MNNREERYRAATFVAQLILENRESGGASDRLMLEQAFDDIRDEVEAGRSNQAAFAVISAELFEQLSKGPTHKTRLVVVDSAGFSVRVEPKEAS